MAVTISTPIANAPFGPGFTVSVNSSFVGPVVNPRWSLDILTSDLAHGLYNFTIPPNIPTFGLVTFFMGIVGMPPPNSFAQHGTTVTFRAALIGDSGTVETGSVNVALDELAGRLYQLQGRLGSIAPGGTTLNTLLNAVQHTYRNQP